MKKQTIEEAVKQALQKHPEGLTVKDITQELISQQLYTFNTNEPESVVNHSIRRSCVGVEIKISKNEKDRVFELAGQGKYKLRK